jgi:hypothetical protein
MGEGSISVKLKVRRVGPQLRCVLVAALFAAIFAARISTARAADDDFDFDLRAPIRVGAGYSHIYDALVLSLSAEQEVSIIKLGEATRFDIILGADAVGPWSSPHVADSSMRKGYFGVGMGGGIFQRLAPHGAAAVLGATIGPLFEVEDDFTPHGVGFTGRVEIFPFYLTMQEIDKCESDGLRTHLLSGLNGWVLARQDWIGSSSGATFAAGIGIDLARHILFPMIESSTGFRTCK